MARLINLCAAAGRRMALGLFRFLSGSLFFHQTDRVPGHEPRRGLSDLPVEILLHIRDFLPLSSSACLILCSRQMMTALGSQCLSSLRARNHTMERRRFLIMLQKDLADWLLCYCCSHFHPVKSLPGLQDHWYYRKEPPCVQENGCLHVVSGFNIRFQHLQLLMNQYRFGRPYTGYLETLTFNFSRSYKDCTLQGDLRCEIVAGQLLLRFSQKLGLLIPTNIRSIQALVRQICPHLRWLGGDPTLLDTAKCRLSHLSNSSCSGCSMLKCCRECSTWFLVGARELDGSKTELLIEAWKYLGSCETPYDPRWRKQAQPQCPKSIFNPSITTAAQWASEDSNKPT